MPRYIAERVAWLLLTLFGVSAVTFGLGVLAPGDPAEVVLEHRLNQPPPSEQVAALRHEMGLDRPLAVQYWRWLTHAVRGDLGSSWLRGIRVSDALRERIPRTLALAFTAGALAVVVGVPVGVLTAVCRNALVDQLCRVGTLVGSSVPSYFAAYVVILIFAVKLRTFPAFGFGSPDHLVLPAVTLALGPASLLARLTRSTVLDVLSEDFVRTARSKGAGPIRLCAHVVRNASVPILTVAGLALGHLLGGSLIIEYVFAYPGMGDLAITAIQARDYPLVQGFVLFSGTAYVLVNFAIDLSYASLDPRIRLGRRG